MKSLLILILCLESFPVLAINLDLDYQEPDEAIMHYIGGLRSGDLPTIKEVLLPLPGKEFQFHLPGPISIHHVEKTGKRVYTAEMVKACKATPKPEEGDVELEVKQYMGPRNDAFMYTYILRKIENSWYILSATSWDQP
ncbi:hypothetical protein M0G74_17075 [Microbulbifer sp. CAU 1566]|uniref:hypothetical protein n=1 Tax=unclassified Microbulbifer TaxID=2619833 RepID=UPI00135CB9C3|nr:MULTISPECIES: hypothetical protein [unclassified Microbulbifer]MCK7598989.1 hypothetical protein [Microbulbifer sp. CAU 1566]